MAATYSLIASSVLNTNTASVTFSGISSAFNDLVLRFSSRNNDTGNTEGIRIEFNSNNSSIYTYVYMLSSGTSAISGRSNVAYGESRQNGNGSTANTFSNGEIYIPSYAASQNKTTFAFSPVETNNAGNNYNTFFGNSFASTTPISSIKLFNSGSIVFLAGSSFYLYGIKNS